MAKWGDRVRETTTTEGLATYLLDGPPTGAFQGFVAGAGHGEVVKYLATDNVDWEVGEGTVTDSTQDTLSRTTIEDSSNGGAAVNWGTGTKILVLVHSAASITQIEEHLDGTDTDPHPVYPKLADSEIISGDWIFTGLTTFTDGAGVTALCHIDTGFNIDMDGGPIRLAQQDSTSSIQLRCDDGTLERIRLRVDSDGVVLSAGANVAKLESIDGAASQLHDDWTMEGQTFTQKYDGGDAFYYQDAWVGASTSFAANIKLRRGRGTEASPSVNLDGDILARINVHGHDGTDFYASPSFQFRYTAKGDHSLTNNGGELQLWPTNEGATGGTKRGAFNHDEFTWLGNVAIGSLTPAISPLGLTVLKESSLSQISQYVHSSLVGHAPYLDLFRSEGTEASPSPVLNNKPFGYLRMGGWYNTGAADAGGGFQIKATAAENWSATNRGSKTEFQSIANGESSLVTRLTIENDGDIGISGNFNVADDKSIYVGGGNDIQLYHSTSGPWNFLKFSNANAYIDQGTNGNVMYFRCNDGTAIRNRINVGTDTVSLQAGASVTKLTVRDGAASDMYGKYTCDDEIAADYFRISGAVTVANLPGTPTLGMEAVVNDASSPSIGSTVTGGGAANAKVWYNGANWSVTGI